MLFCSSDKAFVWLFSLATWLNTIVFAIVLLFSIVVMPGIANLPSDVEYLQAFQVMDAIIQNNQPVFVLVWLGSFASLFATTYLAIFTPVMNDGDMKMTRRMLLLACTCTFVGQVLTVAGNIPLNNRLQTLQYDSLSSVEAQAERMNFEGPWNLYNNARTVLFGITSLIMEYLHRRIAVDSASKNERMTSSLTTAPISEEAQKPYGTFVDV